MLAQIVLLTTTQGIDVSDIIPITMKPLPPIVPIRAGTNYFFDTNFLVLPKAILPKLGKVPKSSRWITETTEQEVIEKLGEEPAREVLDGKFETLHFNDLYTQDPEICPVYYSYIQAMFNPAIIDSEDFIEEMHISKVLRGETLTDEERKIYGNIRRYSSLGQALLPTGKPKPEDYRNLEVLQSHLTKKAKKAAQDKHPAYLRDIRTLSLILYYTLTSKKDVVFYTTDGDPIPLLFKWVDSLCIHLALVNSVHIRIRSKGIRNLMLGKTLEFNLDCKDFMARLRKLKTDIYSGRGIKSVVSFKIRRWNQIKLQFDEDIWLIFPEDMAQLLSTTHGNLWCFYTKNDSILNWLRYRYYWPPKPQETTFLVEVKKKDLINRTSTTVSPEVHDGKCLYRKQDANGEIASWSDFVLLN